MLSMGTQYNILSALSIHIPTELHIFLIDFVFSSNFRFTAKLGRKCSIPKYSLPQDTRSPPQYQHLQSGTFVTIMTIG